MQLQGIGALFGVLTGLAAVHALLLGHALEGISARILLVCTYLADTCSLANECLERQGHLNKTLVDVCVIGSE